MNDVSLGRLDLTGCATQAVQVHERGFRLISREGMPMPDPDPAITLTGPLSDAPEPLALELGSGPPLEPDARLENFIPL